MIRHAILLALAASAAARIEPPAPAARRAFPETSTRIGVFADQLPGGMTAAQERFAATHYVGTQKLTRNLSAPLRAINPNFLVLHYRLAMWQSAPHVPFIVDGERWGNDYAAVDRHEDWFWHNRAGRRVASSQDGKFLMNISNPGFQAYWGDSIAREVAAGDYDGVFLDSASPALLQWEARSPPDPRLYGSGVRDTHFPEMGDRTWIGAWHDWIGKLDAKLAAEGVPLIPNVGGLTTTWDTTDYSITSGAFSEGFLDPGWTEADWVAALNATLGLVAKDRIVILQNYLPSPSDVARRRFLLASYLLVKGRRTYVNYIGGDSLQWYPEWELNLGAARTSAKTASDLLWKGLYRRDFADGAVLVNPTPHPIRVTLDAPLKRVEVEGGGSIGPGGTATGRIITSDVSALDVRPRHAEILLKVP